MRRQHYQRKGFLIAILSACLPAAIIGMILYVLGTQQIEAEAQKTHRNQVAYATERINENLNHLESIMAQWSFNLNLSSSYKDLDLFKDYRSTRSIYQALTWIKSSDPLIQEVTLYLDKQQVLIKESTGIVNIESTEEKMMYQALASYQRDVYWTNRLTPRNENVPYTLIVRIPGGLVETEAALIIDVSAKQLNALIAELDSEGTGSTILMQQDGGIVSLGATDIHQPTSLDLTLMNSVKEQKIDHASAVESWDGEAYSVSYGQMKRIENMWIIAAATPLEQMTKPVQTVSRFMILTGCFGILLALFLSWYSYRQMYQPVQRLMQQLLPGRAAATTDEFATIADEWKHLSRESQILQERVDQQLPSLRENFLLQLLQGHLSFLSENELADRMVQYGWEVTDRVFAVMAVQLHGIYRSEGKFSQGDEQLVTFAAVNITQELTKGKGLDVNTVNFHDMTLGILIRQPSEMTVESMQSNLFHLAEELAHTLNSLLKLEVTVSVGARTSELRRLPFLFDDTRSALNHRKIGEEQQILDVNELIPGGHDAILYPFEEESLLLKALRSGNEPELSHMLDEFLRILKKQSAIELGVRQGLLQLCSNMLNTIMISGYNPLALNEGLDMWEQLAEVREPEAILAWMKQHIIEPYVYRLHSTQDMQLKQLVENVLQTIHTTYAKDISLEACADLHGTYSKKLSVGFKQVTGQTFIDYLTQYRLNQAKKLLVETDEKINDIAIQVGYQPPYFNRLFKKYEGITPGQYREKADQI